MHTRIIFMSSVHTSTFQLASEFLMSTFFSSILEVQIQSRALYKVGKFHLFSQEKCFFFNFRISTLITLILVGFKAHRLVFLPIRKHCFQTRPHLPKLSNHIINLIAAQTIRNTCGIPSIERWSLWGVQGLYFTRWSLKRDHGLMCTYDTF